MYHKYPSNRTSNKSMPQVSLQDTADSGCIRKESKSRTTLHHAGSVSCMMKLPKMCCLTVKQDRTASFGELVKGRMVREE